MALETTDNKKVYIGDGSSLAFTIPFLFLKDADIKISLFDTVTGATAVLKTIVTDYTLTGALDDDGGIATMVVAPISTEELIIEREVDETQLTSYENYNRFPAKTVERGYDRLTMMVQQLTEQIIRSLKVESNLEAADFNATISGLLIAGYMPALNSTLDGLVWTKVVDGSNLTIPSEFEFMVQTAAGVLSAVTLLAGKDITISNPAGQGGDPTIASTAALKWGFANVNTDVISDTEIKLFSGASLRDETDVITLNTSGDLTADITNPVGINGLDQGTESADTHYAVYLIQDTAGVEPDALLLVDEANIGSIVMPTDYDKRRRFDWVYNDSGSDFRVHKKSGHRREMAEAVTIAASLSTVTFADIATDSVTSPSAEFADLRIEASATEPNGDTQVFIARAGASGSSANVLQRVLRINEPDTGLTRFESAFVGAAILDNATRQISMRIDDGGGGTAGGTAAVRVIADYDSMNS